MKNINYKKICCIVIIILFFGASTIPSINGKGNNYSKPTILNSRGAILYVGGSGPNNYSTIQGAIDDANFGDIVYVYDDSAPYYENVIIDKSINVTGENRATTIIDANYIGTVVTITADWVNISGFTIQNCEIDAGLYQYKGIKCISNHNFIFNNDFYSNWGGAIYLQNSDYNVLLGNWIYNSGTNWGISLNNASNNEFVVNDIDSTFIGISVLTNSNNNFFLENTISDTFEGLSMRDSNRNDFIFTNIEDCTDDGANIRHSDRNKFFGGTVTGSIERGFILSYSNYNEVLSNSIVNNGDNGVEIDNSDNNRIAHNDVENNGNYGVYITNSNDNILANNTIDTNLDIGIYIVSSMGNLIRNSSIENHNYGIYITESNDNLIYNNIFENANNAYDDGFNVWNISKTLGKNILKDDGGGYLGGNYWHDDTSSDTNFDGLGNLGVPYTGGGFIANGGDYLPLKIPLILVLESPPDKVLIFWDRLFLHLPMLEYSIIFGPVSVIVHPKNTEHKIKEVVFLLDGEQMLVLTQAPFVWKWKQRAFGTHLIQVNIWDVKGNAGTTQIKVRKFL